MARQRLDPFQSKALKAPRPKAGCLITKLCGGGTATGRWTEPSPRIPKTVSEELSSMTCCPSDTHHKTSSGRYQCLAPTIQPDQTSSYAFGLRVGRPVSLGHVNVPIQDCVRVQVDIGRQMFNTRGTIGPRFDVTG